MSKAYVDTTILTDMLLKSGESKDKAKAALGRYDQTELPAYAIKEFKAGPLSHFVWMHNVYADSKSHAIAMARLQSLSRSFQRNKFATAVEALAQAATSISKSTLGEWVEKYGINANHDRVLADEKRLELKTKIFLAWKKRRSVTTHVTLPLKCYYEAAPRMEGELIINKPVVCDKGPSCCLKEQLIESPEHLQSLKTAIETQPKKRENDKRSQVLRNLIRKPKDALTDNMCRDLGDAIFIFFAPPDAKILTTNKRDFEPMAIALNKEVDTPYD